MQPVSIGAESIGLMTALNSLIDKLTSLIDKVSVLIPAYILLGVVFGVFLSLFMRFIVKVISRGRL